MLPRWGRHARRVQSSRRLGAVNKHGLEAPTPPPHLQAAPAPLASPDAGSSSAAARAVVAAACAATLLAAVHRSSFAVLAVPIQSQFGFSLAQMGVLQSALLLGYLVGQVCWGGGYE